MKQRFVFVIAMLFSLNAFAQERILKVSDVSSPDVIHKKANEKEWRRLKKGTILSQRDSLYFPSHSWIDISVSDIGRIYDYKVNERSCVSVYDVLKQLRKNDPTRMLCDAFQVVMSNLRRNACCNENCDVPGISTLSAKTVKEQDFARFIKSSIGSSQSRDQLLYMRMHKIDKSRFRIEVVNNTDDTYYFNVICIDGEGKAHVCLDYRDNSKPEKMEVSFFLNPKCCIPEEGIPVTFLIDRNRKYYLIASKEKFSWAALQYYLSQNEEYATDPGDYSGFVISEAK